MQAVYRPLQTFSTDKIISLNNIENMKKSTYLNMNLSTLGFESHINEPTYPSGEL